MGSMIKFEFKIAGERVVVIARSKQEALCRIYMALHPLHGHKKFVEIKYGIEEVWVHLIRERVVERTDFHKFRLRRFV